MTYNDWPEDFPPVTSLVPYTALRHNDDPEISELYDRAKNHEDKEAAVELISKLFLQEGAENIRQKIESLSKQNPNAIIVSVHALEGHGKNKIPMTLAEFIGETSGLEVDNSIVQADTVSRTGMTSSWYRMANRPSFDGEVKSGREYILVDDVFSAGGTFSELRTHIENNGGKVVNAVTMANGSKSMNPQLGVTKQHILELEKRYGVESLQQFLKEVSLYEGNHKALTDSEARTILGDSSLDKARDRIFEARQEGNRRIREEVVQGTPLPEEVKNPRNTVPLNNSIDNTLFPNTPKTSEREPFPNRGERNHFNSINDSINRNTIIEPDGSLRIKGISVTKENPASLEAEKYNKERNMSDEFNPLQDTENDLMNEYKDQVLSEIRQDAESITQEKKNTLPSKKELLDGNSPDIELGDGIFKVTESPERIIIFDPRKEEGIAIAKKEGQFTNWEINFLGKELDYELELEHNVGINDIERFLRQTRSDEVDYVKFQPEIQQENKQTNTTSLEADKSISDAQKDSKQETFKNAWHQRNTIMAALKDGTLSCLPGANGLADTDPSVNLETGKVYHGANLLYLKEHQKQLGFPTGEYVTPRQIENAGRDNPNIAIKEGAASVKLQTSEFNEETKQWENKKIELYNIGQTRDPKGLKDWVSSKEQEKTERMKTQFSESFTERKPKGPGPEITCTSTEPEKYLGQYLAAVSLGGTFKASPEQAKEFAAKFEGALEVKMANGHPNPFNLAKITNAASKECQEVMKEIGREERKLNPEQKLERQQKRSRSL